MGYSRTQLRQMTVKRAKLPLITGTSSAGGSTTTIKDTELERFANDALIGSSVYLSSGSPSFTNLTVTDNVQSTGVATFRPTLGAAPDAIDFEVLPWPAQAIHEAIDHVLIELHTMGMSRDVWIKAVSNSPIYNSGMDYWTSSALLDGWDVATATLTRRQTAAAKLTGENAAELNTLAGTLTLARPWMRFLADLEGTVTLRAWVRTGAASNAKISLLDDSGTATSSGSHSGDGEWELLSKQVSLTNTDTERTVQFQTSTTTLAMLGEVWVEPTTRVYEQPIPIALLPDGPTEIYSSDLYVNEGNLKAAVRSRRVRPVNGWDWMRYHDEAANVEYGVLLWKRPLASAQRLWLVGNAPFTLPTTDGAIVEINVHEAILVATLAAIKLYETHAVGMPASTRAQVDERVASLKRDAAYRLDRLNDDQGASLPTDL